MLHVLPEVLAALEAGAPVVALESTLITHGLPAPANLEVARELEALVRAEGAVPATIAVISGTPHVGLSEGQLEALAADRSAVKTSIRDLGAVVAAGRTGSTTVAATMHLAHRAGIGVFATGGIGGVHREATRTLDVSADLTELGRTPVAVVCAGAKAVLDLPLTLEVLETWGVPVLGYGTDWFPAFYTRDAGLTVPHRVDGPGAAAAAIRAHRALGSPTGVVIANPIPEAEALDAAEVTTAIARALTAAEEAGVRGKEVTPFLLARLAELTQGRSLRANRALLASNATVAAQIAVALSRS